MKIFISWSGKKSMEVAKVLKWWIEKIVQTSDAFVSDDDIALGTRWSDTIKKALAETRIGVICVTPENQQAPWINFEAGAISKAVEGQDTKVVPVLIDFKKKTDYKGPLSDYNLALLDRDGLLKLARTANASLSNPKDDADVLETFEAWWPRLEGKLKSIHEDIPSNVQPERKIDDIVSEILETVRDIQKQGRAKNITIRGDYVSLSKDRYTAPEVLEEDGDASGSRLLSEIRLFVNGVEGVRARSIAIAPEGVLQITTEDPLPKDVRDSITFMHLNSKADLRGVVFRDDASVGGMSSGSPA